MAFRKQHPWRFLAAFLAVFGFLAADAQDALGPLGGEYQVSGNLPGNQVRPDLTFNEQGGYVVWQDDAADGSGFGIRAQRLNANLSGALAPIHINSITEGNQEKPRMEIMSDGSVAVVWQGGDAGRQNIYLRILSSAGTFLGGDIKVNQYDEQFQTEPDLAVLADGTIVVVWESFNQDGNLRAVVGRLFASDGSPKGGEFLVNQAMVLNQRSAAVDGLPGGGFVVAWVSETALGADALGGSQFTANIMIRKYAANGQPLGNEVRVNSLDHLCATPSVVGLPGDTWIVSWAQQDVTDLPSGWDVFAAGFLSNGLKSGDDVRLNTYTFGDQFSPSITRNGGTVLVVWSSMGQDGSYEAVVGRVLDVTGQPSGEELEINTSRYNRQVYPSVASDVDGRFLVVWSSYVDGGYYFDLHGQRWAATKPLPEIPAPFAYPLSQSSVALSWPELSGYAVQRYELHRSGVTNVLTTTNNLMRVDGLVTGTSYTFRLGYVLADGRRGAMSPEVTVSTWSADNNFDGLPDDWQRQHWNNDSSNWADRNVDSDNDGASNLAEFLAGTNPVDANSVLRARIEKRGSGVWLDWNATPGLVYQVQRSTNAVDWISFGSSRFAPDSKDTVSVAGGASALFRVLRIREP